MTSAGGLTGFWIIVLVTFYGANLGETKKYFLNVPDVPFPPARPNPENIRAICDCGEARPKYPPSFFPRSGSSYLRRRGNAINQLEALYRCCCRQHTAPTLECAVTAWKQALTKFCDEEFSIMTMAYECCEYRGEERWNCFDTESFNPAEQH